MRGNTVRSILFLVFILLLGAGAAYVDMPNTPGIHIGSYKNSLQVKQGLDLKGGIQIVLEASCPSDQPKCDIGALLPDALNAVQKRVSGGLGVNDSVVRQQGSNRILVQLPGLQDTQQANQLLGKTGKMEIIDTAGTPLAVGTTVTPGQYKVVFTGAQLNPNSIQATLDQNNAPIVTFEFQGAARSAFATYTRDNVGGYLTVALDNSVIESAQIQSEIDGQGQITGIGSITNAQDLATQLKYGALPLPLAIVSEQQLAATLGQQAIEFSIRAALIGLGLVVLFMLIYYRLPGLLADVALVLYALFIFAVIKLLGVTLSLPGIAAMVLTVGMAVDANILIFERMKEELRAGRTMASAIDLGFKRAWPSIRDSNASTIITGAILYWFGSNFGATIIVGFATNLIIGVLLSLFTAVVVTRNFLNLLLFSGIATHPALYSLPADALKVARYNPQLRSTPRRPSVVAPTGAAVDLSEDDVDDEALAGVGAGANGAKPDTARMAEEQTGAEE
ncbi:MAG TPA: protein translocase subunit SecD [Ktedonobacterales bacterium]|jgi:preprotein translocase subunit SecD|nr:protein translocase subunit SecD [Ktedonobacterales bacterium]